MNPAPVHLSSLKLDALALDALPAGERAAARAHLDTCATCRARADELAALRSHFTVNVLPRTVSALQRPPAWRSAWRWWVPALAAATAVLLVMVRPVTPDDGPEFGVKGGAALQLYAHRGERTWKVEEGEALAPGDQVRFRMDGGGLPYALVVSVDGAGQVNTYYPFGGQASVLLPLSDMAELPGSIVLDEAPGPERLFALFSREPLTFDAVAPALRALAEGGAATIRERTHLPVPASAQATFLFEKTRH
ncbi:zf-HC2 domain-containing protein [Pyxidicoccus xibeiensis]|uniref:zf-HC2 domain-containing protein n=1 Tax=Pyxidicoccus xibeiensis TaxID=2906759 RepID=UPI0020A7DEDC|nr:zf-HC2 domain-containing protein [Pyxidicoccus xibeiensis]MCP3143518.1 zf-HC2 domain-containing protein [Pyxidicoccus xibeiensis]